MKKLYRQVELTDDDNDNYVFPNVMAMTSEKLQGKAEIAFELGVRDKRIAELGEVGRTLQRLLIEDDEYNLLEDCKDYTHAIKTLKKRGGDA